MLIELSINPSLEAHPCQVLFAAKERKDTLYGGVRVAAVVYEHPDLAVVLKRAPDRVYLAAGIQDLPYLLEYLQVVLSNRETEAVARIRASGCAASDQAQVGFAIQEPSSPSQIFNCVCLHIAS